MKHSFVVTVLVLVASTVAGATVKGPPPSRPTLTECAFGAFEETTFAGVGGYAMANSAYLFSHAADARGDFGWTAQLFINSVGCAMVSDGSPSYAYARFSLAVGALG